MKIEKIYIPPSLPDSQGTSAPLGSEHVRDADTGKDRHGGNAAYYHRERKKEEADDAAVFKKSEEAAAASQTIPSEVKTEEASNDSDKENKGKSLRVVV